MNSDQFAKLLDKKLKGITDDLEEIGGRLASMEQGVATRSDLLYVRRELSGLEKRYAGLQGRLEKTATKEELESLRKQMATKKDLAGLEKTNGDEKRREASREKTN